MVGTFVTRQKKNFWGILEGSEKVPKILVLMDFLKGDFDILIKRVCKVFKILQYRFYENIENTTISVFLENLYRLVLKTW